MAVFGSLASVQRQLAATGDFSVALAYVTDLLREGSPEQRRLRAVSVGDSCKIDLGGGIFVMEQAYETKPRAEGFFESHQKYIDVQVVLEGSEVMEVAEQTRMQVSQPYQAERDLVLYQDTREASLLRMLPGEVALFFPTDAHMPGLRVDANPVVVRKAVVKIPVGAGQAAA
jgi:biofilm protein TabA